MRQQIAEFLREREVVDIPRTKLYDTRQYFIRGSNHVGMFKNIQPMAIVDPVSLTIPQTFEDGVLRVAHKDPVNFITDVPVNNDDGLYTVEAGAQKKMAQVIADLETVAGGANKDFTLAITKSVGPVVALLDAMVTGAIAVVPATDASISMFQSGPTWLNNAGVIANEDTNIVGIILEAGDTVTATWTNKVADDRCRLSVGEINLPVI